MRALQCVFLVAAIAIPSAGKDTSRIAYAYCPSGHNPIPPITVYSNPTMSIPTGILNCRDKVAVLVRKGSWVRIASTDAEGYVPMTMLSQRNDRFISINLPLAAASFLPEARMPEPGTGIYPPRAISSPGPEYTQAALKAGIHGFVILKLTISADGNPHDIVVVKGLGYGLDENAIRVVRSWKFKPAMQHGVPVDFKGAVEVDFPAKSK
jgi:TonB family protein